MRGTLGGVGGCPLHIESFLHVIIPLHWCRIEMGLSLF